MEPHNPTSPTVRSALTRTLPAFLALSLLWAPGLRGQEQSEEQQPQPQAQEDARQLFAELQQVNQKLDAIRVQALQGSEELQEQQSELEGEIREAMVNIDPEVEGKIERMEEIQMDLQQAQQEGGEQAEVGSLIQELNQLRQSLQQTQGAVMEQEEIVEQLTEFQQALLEEMREVEPEAEELLQRQQELNQKLMGQDEGR